MVHGIRSLTGYHGNQLARLYASLDVFVHTGEAETFCQRRLQRSRQGFPPGEGCQNAATSRVMAASHSARLKTVNRLPPKAQNATRMKGNESTNSRPRSR